MKLAAEVIRNGVEQQRKMRRVTGLLPVLALLLGGVFTAFPPKVIAQVTEEVFARWKDRVVQVQVIDRAAGSKAGIGSGFFAGRNDWVISNYHVVAGLVNEAGRFDARYVADDGSEGSLELLAVDVVHDLALLRTDGLVREPLGVAAELPAGGARLWSMGYPFDIGLTIVEGTFNGFWQNTLYEKLHFTGSVNQGMSGGPTLDGQGRVVGVNVMGGANQVSFLVPVRHVVNLLAQPADGPVQRERLLASVGKQLLANQQRVVDQALAGELSRTRLGNYEVPGGLAAFINCWGSSEEDQENRLSLVYHACQTRDDIYLSHSKYTGSIAYQHDEVSTDGLATPQFWRQLENRSYYPRLEIDGDEESVTNFRCQSGFVRGENVPLKVTWCVRAYRKYDGLFDAYVTATSLQEDQRALQTSMTLNGFSWESLERLGNAFLGGIRWAP